MTLEDIPAGSTLTGLQFCCRNEQELMFKDFSGSVQVSWVKGTRGARFKHGSAPLPDMQVFTAACLCYISNCLLLLHHQVDRLELKARDILPA